MALKALIQQRSNHLRIFEFIFLQLYHQRGFLWRALTRSKFLVFSQAINNLRLQLIHHLGFSLCMESHFYGFRVFSYSLITRNLWQLFQSSFFRGNLFLWTFFCFCGIFWVVSDYYLVRVAHLTCKIVFQIDLKRRLLFCVQIQTLVEVLSLPQGNRCWLPQSTSWRVLMKISFSGLISIDNTRRLYFFFYLALSTIDQTSFWNLVCRRVSINWMTVFLCGLQEVWIPFWCYSSDRPFSALGNDSSSINSYLWALRAIFWLKLFRCWKILSWDDLR